MLEPPLPYASNLAGVDAIYVINLDERPEKWARMQEIFSENNLKINRFPGINGWKLASQTVRELTGHYGVRLSKGQIGCLLSHLSVINDAYNRNFKTVWICEDDVDIVDCISEIPELLTELSSYDPEWDVFFTDLDSKNRKGEYVLSLGSDFRPDHPHAPIECYFERTLLNERIMTIKQRFGLYSYILSRSGMEKILNFFNENFVWTAIDIDIHYIPNIREYSTTKEIVTIWHKSPHSDTTKKVE